MKNIHAFSITALFISVFVSCTSLPGSGVPKELADSRKAAYGSVSYNLEFSIPESMGQSIPASERICLELDRKQDIILDWRDSASMISSVEANGRKVNAVIGNEHIIIPGKATRKGSNDIVVSFTAGEQSLNRREEFMYTLLVPDRARTLFPCFDQPDLKATYTLSLVVPDGWSAVSNTAIATEEKMGDGKARISFAPTEPLSTYLFSFVAGRFEKVSGDHNGRTVNLYHRETDRKKITQCTEVLDLVFSSLDYLEEYTGTPYPFAKYDLIVLPDFQYGGMEHTGATLYNDRRIFLGEKPTTDELLGRASLIAHETAHMWFGDYVTMKWFNDVWTKEVFANWFASKMVRPVFPEVNHHLGDLRSYYAPAYSEDRTLGSNAIQRPLDNLSNAGLIYCNIIYDKAPVVMEKLAEKLGHDRFRSGIQEYLRRFGYSNADWDDLIQVFSEQVPGDASSEIKDWSRIWIKEKGMPVYKASIQDGIFTVTQHDPFGEGKIWPQSVEYGLISGNGSRTTVKADFSDSSVFSTEAPDAVICLPNTDAMAYGCFEMDERTAEWIYRNYTFEDDNTRMSLLMTLYENVWRQNISAQAFLNWVSGALEAEADALIQTSMLNYAGGAAVMPSMTKECRAAFEARLDKISSDNSISHELRLLAFRRLYQTVTTVELCDKLYTIWETQVPPSGMTLGESDYTSLAYELMMRFPEKAEMIRDIQSGRITNPDRKETFSFISQATAADQASRDAFFESILEPANRKAESRVRTALAYLNSETYSEESVKYIRPALEELERVQRTGDIFFPANWCSSLLSGHTGRKAYEEVRAFIEEHPDYNPLLKTKILQAAGLLYELYDGK